MALPPHLSRHGSRRHRVAPSTDADGGPQAGWGASAGHPRTSAFRGLPSASGRLPRSPSTTSTSAARPGASRPVVPTSEHALAATDVAAASAEAGSGEALAALRLSAADLADDLPGLLSYAGNEHLVLALASRQRGELLVDVRPDDLRVTVSGAAVELPAPQG